MNLRKSYLSTQNAYAKLASSDCGGTSAVAVAAPSTSDAPAFPRYESLSGVYTVLRKLGKGAFGTTYLVQREGTALFALKEITCSTDKQRNVALQEVTAFARVPPSSPYIVGFEEVFLRTPPEGGGTNVCLVMNFCGGPTLESIIVSHAARNETVPEATINRWLRDLCHGLEVLLAPAPSYTRWFHFHLLFPIPWMLTCIVVRAPCTCCCV